MGINVLRMVPRLWRCMIFSIVTCYRSVRDHPFVSLMAVIFYLLYTFLPSVFGFIVSSSPIVVCTVVLLGALLNFGYPQTPHFEQKCTINVPSLKDDLVVEKDGHVGKRPIVEKEGMKEKEVGLFPINKDGLVDRTVVIEEKPKQIHGHKPPIQKEREFHNVGFIKKRDTQNENQLIEGVSNSGVNQSTKVLKKMKKMKGLKLEIDRPVSGLPNSHLKEWLKDPSCHHRNEDNAESSDFGSDRAQCSSPLDSIADIIPVLDELHPLLDFKPLQSNLSSIEESDAASQWSDRSNDGSVESELEESEEEEEEAENQEVEDEVLESEDERIKPVVTWTEDDEKNLKDLGTSELERNQRLETLVAKRRARKTLSMDVEINLIDLESNDPPTQIAPILITRNNPFEIPYYSNETGELQPIPSSAPSVLLPRRNPFDLPFEPFDERSNLNGDNFQQDFSPVHLDKDMSFCRHQSFSLGSSFGVQIGKDKRNINLSSFLGRMASEETGDPTLQRQFSERSESKLSCVLETETVYTVSDEDLSPKSKLVSQIGHSPDRAEQVSQTSEEVDSSVEIDQEDKKDVHPSKVETNGVDGEMTHLKVETNSKSSSSSPSASSEANEKILHENINEGQLKNQDQTKGDCIEGTSDFEKPSLSQIETELKSKFMEQPDEVQIEEPVYDSSPSAMETMSIEDALLSADKEAVLTSTSSTAFDSKVDTSDEKTSSLTDQKSLLANGSIKNETSLDNEVMREASSHLSAVEENELRSKESTEASEQNVTEVEFSEAENEGDPIAASPVPKSSVVEQSPGKELVEQSPVKELVEDGPINEVTPSTVDPEIFYEVHKSDVEEEQHLTSSPSSASQEKLLSVEKPEVQLSSEGDHKQPEVSQTL
ncbi:hypothetical protein BVC80_479g56 [Macleaya cordata]|uniref:Cardiomyopathy-associated protein 5 n=1 Tax=Macleaya cordata TaxID=56857 RepID=A0A200Q7P8_MACCD|nr:hypothetical protein BVC80_479g56 [Macleaya cordata]